MESEGVGEVGCNVGAVQSRTLLVVARLLGCSQPASSQLQTMNDVIFNARQLASEDKHDLRSRENKVNTESVLSGQYFSQANC